MNKIIAIPIQGTPTVFYTKDIKNNIQTVQEGLQWCDLSCTVVYVFNKKQFIKYFQNTTNQENIIDINIVSFIKDNKLFDFKQAWGSQPIVRMLIKRWKDSYLSLMPHTKIKQICSNFVQPIMQYTQIDLNQEMLFYNDGATIIFHNIEKNGICINKQLFNSKYPQFVKLLDAENLLHSNYNLNTTTGRPSNTIGINLAALNKTSGDRQFIVSRFKGGVLMQIDFSAYHLALISEIVGYNFPDGCNIHQYMAKIYYNTQSPSDEQIQQGKQLSFALLYGRIKQQYLHIPFFKLISQYIDYLWAYYRKNDGFIPVVNRKVKHINKKQTLFNYLIQNYQTKNNVIIMQKLQDHIKGMQSKMILYTYDSILFDIKREQISQVYNIIKNTLRNNYRYKIHYSIGFNYGNMKKI